MAPSGCLAALSRFRLRYPQVGVMCFEPHSEMILHNADDWEIAAGLTAAAGVAATAAWLILRRRPSADEVERARRQFLVQSGRLVDGMLLDIYEVEAKDGRTLTMLLFSYRIGGVDYESSQDITAMREVVNAGRGEGRISVHGALSTWQPLQQHCCGGRLDGTARTDSAIALLR